MGIFGIRKAAGGSARSADPAQIRRLVPFMALSAANLAKVAPTARIEPLRSGVRVPDEPETVLFLHGGRLSVAAEGRPPLVLDADDPASAFPLPGAPEFCVTTLTACQLLKVPSRFMVLAAGTAPPGSGIDWRGGNAEDGIYQEFYQELKNGKCELPSMPDLARRIGEVIDDPTTASEHIARVIQTDPALAARLMSVVNSAAYNTGPAIQNLSQAVSRLGREQVRNLVFSFIVKSIFQTDSAPLRQRMKALWAHSCHVGAIAATLARHTPGLDPERALLAGLVHDIGVVPILDKAREFPDLLEDPDTLELVINDLRGEIGVLTMRQWGFDRTFIDIVARAEDWLRPGTAVADYLDVVLLAQLHAYVGTPRMTELPRIDQVPAFRKLAGGELTPRGSMAIIDDAQREIQELRRLLEAG